MTITTPGRYRLTEDIALRGTISISTLPAGAEIEITQVDADGHKVIGPQLGDWLYWNIPAEPLPSPSAAPATETEDWLRCEKCGGDLFFAAPDGGLFHVDGSCQSPAPASPDVPRENTDPCPRCGARLVVAGDAPHLVTCEGCGRRWPPKANTVYPAPASPRPEEPARRCILCSEPITEGQSRVTAVRADGVFTAHRTCAGRSHPTPTGPLMPPSPSPGATTPLTEARVDEALDRIEEGLRCVATIRAGGAKALDLARNAVADLRSLRRLRADGEGRAPRPRPTEEDADAVARLLRRVFAACSVLATMTRTAGLTEGEEVARGLQRDIVDVLDRPLARLRAPSPSLPDTPRDEPCDHRDYRCARCRARAGSAPLPDGRDATRRDDVLAKYLRAYGETRAALTVEGLGALTTDEILRAVAAASPTTESTGADHE
jgi:hypothetical protein